MVATFENSLFNFQQFIQFQSVNQGHAFFPEIVSVLFDEAFYLSKNPDVATALLNGAIGSGLQHFLSGGIFENRTPSPFYDEDLFLLSNPDVAAAVSNGLFASGLHHYVQAGFYEGRDPLALTYEIGGIQISALFDEDQYLHQYADIAAVVDSGSFSYGFEHFVRFGISEGRSPSFLYDENRYLSSNTDVKDAVAAGAFSSGLVHYLKFGHLENRVASFFFDPHAYLDSNPDVAAAVSNGSILSAFEHYVESGASEGRLSSLFYEEAYYLAQNPDVAAAVSSGGLQSGYHHFVTSGIREGRSPSASYREDDYLSANPDVASAISSGIFVNGLEHYIKFGRSEGRELIAAIDFSDSNKAVFVDLGDDKAAQLTYGADFHLMPLGDSITEGWDASTTASQPDTGSAYQARHEGYRLDLWEKFQALGLPVDFVGSLSNGPNTLGDKDHEGHGGKGINWVKDRVNGFINAQDPDVILLMLGTNDGGASGDKIASLLSSLLNKILDNSQFTGKVLVGTVPPARTDGRYANRADNLADYNSRIAGVVASKETDRLTFVEVGSLLDPFQDMADPSVDNGLHPNQQGYAKIANAWYDALLDVVFEQQQSTNGQSNIVGSSFDDVLIGNSGANRIEGGPGDDLLTGGGGPDRYVFRSPDDGVDTITDFSSDDVILISNSGFGGNLSGGFSFGQGSSRPTFLYNASNGILSYDQDGDGGQSASRLLRLSGAPDLTSDQIVIV